MKKWLSGLLVAGIVIGGSTAAFATGNGHDVMNFGKMLPYMQQMHPDLSNEQLKDMYNDCHGTNGSSESKNFENNMNMMQQGM